MILDPRQYLKLRARANIKVCKAQDCKCSLAVQAGKRHNT